MPCYKPLSAYSIGIAQKTGKKVIRILSGNEIPASVSSSEHFLKLPCGQCIGCRLERSRQWAIRCVHEASLYERNCFITLTFNEEYLNKKGSLVKADFQNFMKRLRKKYYGNQKGNVRYFHCGEYGEKFTRPHHHACLFNFDFDDKTHWQTRDRIPLFVSKSLQELWPFGFSTVGGVTFESAAYVARYVVKKINGQNKDAHYCGRLPEYTTMSRRPGLARGWFQKFGREVYPSDEVVIRGEIVARPPRYYDKIFELTNPEDFKIIKEKRVDRAKSDPNNTPERLQTRYELAVLRGQKLKRGYENANL